MLYNELFHIYWRSTLTIKNDGCPAAIIFPPLILPYNPMPPSTPTDSEDSDFENASGNNATGKGGKYSEEEDVVDDTVRGLHFFVDETQTLRPHLYDP